MMPAQRPLRVSLRAIWLSYLYQKILGIVARFKDEPSFKSLSVTVTAFCEVLASIVLSILCCKIAFSIKASPFSCGVT